MKKVLIIIGIIGIILLVGGVWVYKNLTKEKISMPNLENKKIAMIIAFREFRDEEYFIPKRTFETAGAQVVTISSSLGKAIGKMGGEADVDILIENLKVADFDAVLFIGGPGAADYIDDETCHKIARETVEQNKILGAICIAPAILAKAGVLEGKKATVWNSPMDKSAVKILKESGTNFQSESVVVDGKIVTADGPDAAEKFAEAIIRTINEY